MPMIFLFAAQRYQMRFFKPGMQLLVVGKVRAGTAGKMVSEAFIQVVYSNEAASGWVFCRCMLWLVL